MHIFHSSDAHAFIAGSSSICYIHAVFSSTVQTDVVHGGTFIQLVLQQFVVLHRQGQVTRLGNTPGLMYVTVDRAAAQIIAHAGIIIRGQDGFAICQGVDRVKSNALIVFREHDLVEGFAL